MTSTVIDTSFDRLLLGGRVTSSSICALCTFDLRYGNAACLYSTLDLKMHDGA